MGINFDKLAKKLEKANKDTLVIFVGWENEKYSGIAKMQEYGGATRFGGKTVHIPARPHKKQTIEKNRAKWKATLSKLFDADKDILTITQLLALSILQSYQAEMKSGNFTALSPATIEGRKKRKNSPNFGTTPLDDTGDLIRNMTHEVYRV